MSDDDKDLPESLSAAAQRMPSSLHLGAEIAALTVVVRRLVAKAVSDDAKDAAEMEKLAAHVHALCQEDLGKVRFMSEQFSDDQRGIASNLIDKVFLLPQPK